MKQFDVMSQMMTQMAGKGVRERMKMVREMQATMSNPNGQLTKKKLGTGKRLNPKDKARLKKDRQRDMRRRKREKGRN